MSVGEWLAMSDEQGRPLILSVAFIGDDYAFFVLVRPQGRASRARFPLEEMADGLHGGASRCSNGFDLPLMERASQRMLPNMHNQLTYQAARRSDEAAESQEFERNLAAAIESAKATSAQHVLFYLDLDQFKIVNNSSGHTAGDELLKMVGQRLVEGLKDVPAKVARLGGDEFGVLITDIENDRRAKSRRRLLKLVREQRFDWEDRHYSLSVSIGVVLHRRRHAERPTRRAFCQTEACYAAKGRRPQPRPGVRTGRRADDASARRNGVGDASSTRRSTTAA